MERIFKNRLFYFFELILILWITFSCSEDFYDAEKLFAKLQFGLTRTITF